MSPYREWYNNWVKKIPKGNVLDIGKSQEWDYGFTTIDTDKNRKPTIFGDITDNNLPANCYDTVLCFGMYEYVDDTDKMIREVKRILKEGGTALFGFTGTDYPHHGKTGKKFNNVMELKDFIIKEYKGFGNEYHIFVCQKPISGPEAE